MKKLPKGYPENVEIKFNTGYIATEKELEIMKEAMENEIKAMEEELFNTSIGTYTTSGKEAESLTFESIQKIIDVLYPVLYYTIDKNIESGKFYFIKETDFNPEFVTMHPDDFEDFKSMASKKRKLVHLKDEPKEKVIDRVIKNMRKYL